MQLAVAYKKDISIKCKDCGHTESDHASKTQMRIRTPCEHPNCECLDFCPIEHKTWMDDWPCYFCGKNECDGYCENSTLTR